MTLTWVFLFVKVVLVDAEVLLEKYKLPVGLGLIGLVLASFGVLLFSLQKQAGPEVEILTEEETGMIFVDLEGAVEKPGLYELPAGSRLNEVLIQAGGLSAEADRDWVAQNLNLAEKLVDGAKFFIPTASDNISSGQVAGTETVTVTNAKISINHASLAQLDTLWGIGEARAQSIIENRPYQTLEELKSKAGIPTNVYDRIKDEITLW